MSHSKRNTSLAFFTAHERSLLRNNWGSQSTRLTRDAFLPFGYCRLCLGIAVDPVACNNGADTRGSGSGSGSGSHSEEPKVHLFCRECALNDLVSQRKEIQRLERDQQARDQIQREEKEVQIEEERQREVERFERGEMGIGDDANGDVRGVKRKRGATEMHSSSTSTTTTTTVKTPTTTTSKDSAGGSTSNGESNGHGHSHSHGSQKTDSKRSTSSTSESSFWIPSVSTISTASGPTIKHKLQPICPASTPTDKHTYNLKSLVTVQFTEVGDDNDRDNNTKDKDNIKSTKNKPTSRICPSCQKVLTNTSRARLGTAVGCGHVVCGGCAALFLKGSSSDSGISCYVCQADLSGRSKGESSTGEDGNKSKKSKSKHKHNTVGRLVEVSCEGTGFAGGGTNIAKRDGVAFQC